MEELNLDQLEVGEWYELKGDTEWLRWFSKHKGIHDGNCEISSEFIQQSSGLDFKKHTYTWCSDYTFRKATKEQLKSVLPKDHPDYPIENSDYKWLLILQENIDSTDFKKGAIAEIDRLNGNSFRMKRHTYDIMLSRLAEGKIKPFLTKEEAEKYWDSINVKPVDKPVEKESGIGKWCDCGEYPKYLVFIKSGKRAYGWNIEGNWFDDYSMEWSKDLYTPIKDASILKDKFLQEAKKRYSEGDYVKLLNENTGGCHKNQIYFSNMFFERISNNIQQFYIDGNLLIFYDGKWAEKISKPVETPKTKQLSDLKKGDWVKHISPSNSNFILNHLYKLDRDWDRQEVLVLNAQNRGDGYSPNNANNFTVPTQQEIETWEKSLIKDEPKEFVLPEKWCIKATEKNVHILKQTTHCNKHLNYNYTIGGYYGTEFGGDWQLPEGYTEITFEQFEKYVLKSKVTAEDEPKEDMKTIPKYWYIENKYQEVRDYLADTYDESCIKNWTFGFIGWDESPSHKGCHGFRSVDEYVEKATKITIEQFREYFLKKPKEVLQDDYSWWSELEEGDIIESLTDYKPSRNKGEKFTVLENDKGYVSYTNLCASYAKEEWKLISKAKDKVKESPTHRIETTITTSPNWYETSINDKPITQFCPQPEETEIVPISKYFKIRN